MMWFLIACAPKAELEFDPPTLELGEVDFTGELPDDGYVTETVTLTNVGTATVTLSLPEYDAEHLCLKGYTTQAFPVSLGPVAPESAFTFIVGICAYISGEIDTQIETVLEIDTDGDPATVSLPITFTPIRTTE